jgi:hypothetical protein
MRPTAAKTFAQAARERQLAWARTSNIPRDAFEEQHAWVFKPEHKQGNLFRPEWWSYIAGKKEHRWARALNSSQCFAVNLFAPLKDGDERARAFLQSYLFKVGPRDTVRVEFEFTPPKTEQWLGERDRQPTQIDVYFQIARAGHVVGHLLVEVKFTEVSFGCCRGWNGRSKKEWLNLDRKRCEHVDAVIADPQSQCWLVQERGRRYWQLISLPDSSIKKPVVEATGACPFRYGLYQMMRNRVLADELIRRSSGAEWANFVVCCHLENDAVLHLKEPVLGTVDAIAAFQALSSSNGVQLWNAEDVVRRIGSTDEQLAEWEKWMRSRYFAVEGRG